MHYAEKEVIIVPKFQKEFPQDALRYFHPDSDEEFKRKNPSGYKVLVACGITGLMLPQVLYIIATLFLWPAPDSGFLLLGYAGCFIIGIGIFNIVAAWIGQYLGQWVTAGSFLLGGVLVAVSCVLLYIPDIYAVFDEELVDCYFLTLLLLCLIPIFYVAFRGSVDSWLRRKRVSKSKIKKLTKGKRNYWWYESIHQEYDMGKLYPLNKLVTVTYPLTLGLAIFLGWIRFVIPMIAALHALTALAMSALTLFSMIQGKLEKYGVPIVILRRDRQQKGIDSIIIDLGVSAMPMVVAYSHWKMVLETLP